MPASASSVRTRSASGGTARGTPAEVVGVLGKAVVIVDQRRPRAAGHAEQLLLPMAGDNEDLSGPATDAVDQAPHPGGRAVPGVGGTARPIHEEAGAGAMRNEQRRQSARPDHACA